MRLCTPARALAAALALAATPAFASTTVTLPGWACRAGDVIFAHGFETQAAVPSDPSGGSGGAVGSSAHTIAVAGISGLHKYYVYTPPGYRESLAWPLLIALHGAPGTPQGADTAAQQARTDWGVIAAMGGFVVAAPVAGGSQGGWIAPSDPTDTPTDYDVIAAVRNEVESIYNIERTRRYVWGFSAGGHVAEDLVFNNWGGFGVDTTAALGVSAGALRAVTCDVLQPTVYTRPTCPVLLGAQTRKIPSVLSTGVSDTTVPHAEVQADVNRLLSAGWTMSTTVFYDSFSGGHTYAGRLDDIWADICKTAVVP